MSAVVPFTSCDFSVRAVQMDGEAWFVGKDVAIALGYADPTNAIKQHCKGVAKHHPLQTAGGEQLARVLTEADVLRLIVSSRLPAAEKFERWVFEEVLPSIRKTGSYQAAPRTAAEVVLASAQALVEMERKTAALEQQQVAQQQAVARIENRVDALAQSRVWDHCPQNCESITKIRPRINKLYGLPDWVIDMVVRGLPMSPKAAGEVRNQHENAGGGHYTVWAIADVTRVFRAFVAECQMVTANFATHPHIDRRFQLDRTGIPPSQLIRRQPVGLDA